MAAPKGNRNNPDGRPPKNKALSTMLEVALEQTSSYKDKRMSGKRILSSMVADALITGRVLFPNDTEYSVISIKDWLDLVKWAYERIDGKPMQRSELTGANGGAIIIDWGDHAGDGD